MSPAFPAPIPPPAALIGNTPLVHLARLSPPESGPRVLAKLECFNPGGSAKDRSAQGMLAAALADGLIAAGDTVVESSSGNLGVALAQQCAWAGLRFECVIDPRTTPTARALIRAYGGTLHEVVAPDPVTGDWLAARIARVAELVAMIPGAWWPNQYANPHNPRAHSAGTATEIFAALPNEPTAIFVATSTTGTLGGVLQQVAARSARTEVVAVDSAGSVLFGGTRGPRRLPGLGAGVEPPLAVGLAPDRLARVTDADCVRGCRRLARAEGLLMGASSGGVVSAYLDRAETYGPEDTVVLICHDAGERYLDTVYDDAWVAAHLPEVLLDDVAAVTDGATSAVGPRCAARLAVLGATR